MKYLKGIRDIYSEIGVKDFYNKHVYINPHLMDIHRCLEWLSNEIDIGSFLDMSAGNGEISSYLLSKGYTDFMGTDPYLYDSYKQKTKRDCLELSFEEMSTNGLPEKFNTIICSYALHLCPKSYLNNLLYNISTNCKYFAIISPTKYPEISEEYFEYLDEYRIGKSRCRLFKSLLNISSMNYYDT